MQILVDVFSMQYVLEAELLDLNPTGRNTVEEKDLRFGFSSKTAGDGDRLRHSRVVSQVILAGLAYLA